MYWVGARLQKSRVMDCLQQLKKLLPGILIPFLMPMGSFLDHLATSSSILVIFSGFMPHRQPFLWFPFDIGFSIFSKHLFRLKLWRTEFFQPDGAVLK